MLKKLVLQNFRVFEDQTIEFKEGTIAIVGPNGAGKTTILEAIEFALFSKTKRKEKDLRLKDLIRHGNKRAVVKLSFIAPANGRQYTVTRKIFENRSEGELVDDMEKKVIATGVKQVNSEIVKLLGVDRDAFAALIYVRQGDISILSRLPPRKKKESLRDMMGFGIYSNVEDRVRKRIKQLRDELSMIKAEHSRLSDIRDHLPTQNELLVASEALDKIEEITGQPELIMPLRKILSQVRSSLEEIQQQLDSPEILSKKEELDHQMELANTLRNVLIQIPMIAEEDLKPLIQDETRSIFRSIFGDRYSDLIIDDEYDIQLFNLQGHRVPLRNSSGGEDVCVNFSLRVAVNTTLQKMLAEGKEGATRTLNMLILDEPGAGLDSQRRRWLPEAIQGLSSVDQVIIVTHMEELKEAADVIINLNPQGKNRPPRVIIER